MRYIPTCWEDCNHCGTELFSVKSSNPKRVVFAWCDHFKMQGHKCFETDAICENCSPKAKPVEAKPATRGWDDF